MKQEKDYWSQVILLSLVMALRMLGLFMALPVLAYGARSLNGATVTLIGMCIGIHGISQSMLQIPFGYWSDRWQRKPILVLGLIAFAIGSLVAALTNNIWLVIFGRLLQGAGAVGGVILAAVSDHVTFANQPRAVAVYGAGIGGAFVLALFVGPAIYNTFGLSGVFWGSFVCAILALLLVLLLPVNAVKHTTEENIKFIPAFIQFWHPKAILPIYFITAGVMHAVLAASFMLLPCLGVKMDLWLYAIPIAIALLIIWALPLKDNKISSLTAFIGIMFLGQIFIMIHATAFGFSLFLVAFIVLESILPALIVQRLTAKKGWSVNGAN